MAPGGLPDSARFTRAKSLRKVQELSYADFLDGLLSEEVSAKTAKHVTMRTNLARFPFIKGLDSFDFTYQPSVDRKQIQKLSLCHFVEHGENLVLLGPPSRVS